MQIMSLRQLWTFKIIWMYVRVKALAPFELLFKHRKRITYFPILNSHMLKGMKPGPRPPIYFHLELSVVTITVVSNQTAFPSTIYERQIICSMFHMYGSLYKQMKSTKHLWTTVMTCESQLTFTVQNMLFTHTFERLSTF